MSRARMHLTLAHHAPSLLEEGGTSRLSFFGGWLREQLTQAAGEWPAIRIIRLAFGARSVRLVCTIQPHAPALPSALALAQALVRTTTSAARTTGWIDNTGRLWQEDLTEFWCITRLTTNDQRLMIPLRLHPPQQHHRQREEHDIH